VITREKTAVDAYRAFSSNTPLRLLNVALSNARVPRRQKVV